MTTAEEVRGTEEFDLLVSAVRRAYAIEHSVTQGQEKELRVGYRDLLERAMVAIGQDEP